MKTAKSGILYRAVVKKITKVDAYEKQRRLKYKSFLDIRAVITIPAIASGKTREKRRRGNWKNGTN